mmetsp:Transcript_56296/g.175009  ORF Transcript_56296/g.175009 Transcript_56296/m.175009 type:complete len:152 (+) Transcript_56296:1249-1704(+)
MVAVVLVLLVSVLVVTVVLDTVVLVVVAVRVIVDRVTVVVVTEVVVLVLVVPVVVEPVLVVVCVVVTGLALAKCFPPSHGGHCSWSAAVPENMNLGLVSLEPLKSTTTGNSEAWKKRVTAWSFSASSSVKGSRGLSVRAAEVGTKKTPSTS